MGQLIICELIFFQSIIVNIKRVTFTMAPRRITLVFPIETVIDAARAVAVWR